MQLLHSLYIKVKNMHELLKPPIYHHTALIYYLTRHTLTPNKLPKYHCLITIWYILTMARKSTVR